MVKVLLCMAMRHDWRLVAVAAIVCIAATQAAFFLYSRTPLVPGWRRWACLGMTGLVAGAGIWTTHFVAMLAFRTGLATGFALAPTLGSLAVAIGGATAGFWVGAARQGSPRTGSAALAGGLIVGLSIALMHYLGMSGYRTAGILRWDALYMVASVLVGAAYAAAALGVARSGAGAGWRQPAGGLLLGLGIVGMHFTGMAAVTIIPDPTLAVPPSLISDGTMATAAVAMTALIVATAIFGAAFDAAGRNGALRRLREAIEVMPEGLAFFDASDRLVAWNAQYDSLCRAVGVRLAIGVAFPDVLHAIATQGAYAGEPDQAAAWLAERASAHQTADRSVSHRTAAGRWLRISERRTADGGTVCVTVDITDLKRVEEDMALARDRAEESARRADEAELIAGLGHWRLDARTHGVTWSTQMKRIYGLQPDGPLDLETVLAMTHPDDAALARDRVQRQLATGESAPRLITRVRRPSGEVRFLEGKSRAERAPDGEIVALVGTLVDVTEQRLAEAAVARSEERFRRLAVNAPDMITECSLEGLLTYVSPASLAVTGYAPEELVGQTFASIVEPADAAKVLEMCQAVFASKGRTAPWPVEFRATHKDGRPLWLECKPTLAVDPQTGRFTGLTDVVRDITGRKTLEAQLRAAQAEAEAAAAVKGEFLANMSHELRTPLTSIIGFIGLAEQQPELSGLTRDYIGRVRNASRALLCTVNDILDFSKLEAGQVTIHPEPVSLTELCRETLELFTPQASAKDLSLTLDDGGAGEALVLAIDPDRIRQVLLNFVSNAVKFTASGGVTLRARYDRGGGKLSVEVIDTGAGVPEEKQQQLFKRFSQVDGSLTRAQAGTGLGLAICKGLIEAMGGEIGVESRLGTGSRFWFAIPASLAALPGARSEAPESERPPFAGVRVLVADDHATNRELARLFLAGIGAEVTEAIDGEDAARLAGELPFDVILMDLRMPRLDGVGALRRIRAADGPNDATPILAFTADADPRILASLESLGFQGMVAKPLEPAALIAAIARATAFLDGAENPAYSVVG